MPRQPLSNREIFAQWMADHRGIIIKIVRSFTSDPTDAEDLTQEISLALWRSIPSFRGEAKPSTWIWRIALNRAISWQRATPDSHVELRDSDGLPAFDGGRLSAPDPAEAAVSVDRIYAAIKILPPIDRSLIVLSLEGYRYTEIASITGLSPTNVGARLSRARNRLAQELEVTP